MIKAFRNGFPSNWKTFLNRDYGKQEVSTVSTGNERPIGKRINTPAQDDREVLKLEEKPLAQQIRESAQRGRPVIQQSRSPKQEERQTVVEITPKGDSPHRMRDIPRRDNALPIPRASVQLKQASSQARIPTLATPTGRTLSREENMEILIPVMSAESLSASYAMSGTPKGPTNKKSEPKPESSPDIISRKESTPTKKIPASAEAPPPSITTLPVSARTDIQEGVPVLDPLSTTRRASVPIAINLQGDALGLRRFSAPNHSSAGMGAWKAVGRPTVVGVDRPLDKSLDGNLRMRSMAVVEQIREHTRQHSDMPAGVVRVVGSTTFQDGERQPEIGSVAVVEERLRDVGGNPATTLLPFAKSLSSISSSSQSQFDDFDLGNLDEVNLLS